MKKMLLASVLMIASTPGFAADKKAEVCPFNPNVTIDSSDCEDKVPIRAIKSFATRLVTATVGRRTIEAPGQSKPSKRSTANGGQK